MKKATITNTALMGIIAGLAGIEHGVGEILQGSVAPDGLVIQSWPDSAAMQIVNGEPALTVIPNLLVTGILAILFSLIFIAWATLPLQTSLPVQRSLLLRRRFHGLVLMLICIPMLLFGAGFGPPLLGLIIGAAASKTVASTPAASSAAGHRSLIPARRRTWLGRFWPWSLAACLATWLAMMPGTVLLNHFWGIHNDGLVLGLLLAMFALLFLTILTGFAHDSQQPAPGGGPAPGG